MVKYLIDSDVLINFLKGKPDSIKLLSSLKGDEIAVSVISIAEILEGVAGSEAQKEQAINLLELFHASIVNRKVAEVFAVLRSDLRKKGSLIDNMDLLIAATALAENLILVTYNQKHFARINQLKIYSI